jgi:hypothetical protein
LNPATTYRYQLYSAVGALLEDIDPYIPSPTPSQAQVGSVLYPLIAAETAAGVTPSNFAYPPYNVLRYGAIADGNNGTGVGTDNQAAFSRAISVANTFSPNGGGLVYIPSGIYKLITPISIPVGVTVRGDGKWTTILFCPNSFATVAGLVQFNGSGGPPAKLQSLAVLGQNGGAGGNGIVVNSNGTFLEDIWCGSFVGVSSAGIVLNSTDVFLNNFAVELCLQGIQINATGTSINIENGTLYGHSAAGMLIINSASVENGRVIVTAVRASDCAQDGFVVSGGKCVTFNGCSTIATTNAKNTHSGFDIDTSDDVVLNGCTARVTGTASAAGVGILAVASSAVVINGCSVRGFQDGVRLTSCNNIDISGGMFNLNGRRGIWAGAGDNIQIAAVTAKSNSESGIYDENSDANCNHSIVGCTAQSNTTYGIYSNLTGSGFTTIVGNTARLSGTKDINIVAGGNSQNHNLSGNLPGPFGLGTIPSVASATALTLPDFFAPVMSVTGTTNITSIVTTGFFGQTRTLNFISAACTVTDGSNLLLAGNFVSTALSTLTLFCNGANWIEIARSLN